MSKHIVGEVIHSILQEYQSSYGLSEVPISVDLLREIIKRRSGFTTISWAEVEVSTKNLFGYVKFYYPIPAHIRINEEPTTAVIRFKKSLSYCWKRFVICKEMCHCLIDSEEEYVGNASVLKGLIEALASGLPFDQAKKGAYDSEMIAEIMALELLYPLELRRTHAEELKAGGLDYYSLALRYRIPQEFAEVGMYENYLMMAENIRDGKFLNLS